MPIEDLKSDFFKNEAEIAKLDVFRRMYLRVLSEIAEEMHRQTVCMQAVVESLDKLHQDIGEAFLTKPVTYEDVYDNEKAKYGMVKAPSVPNKKKKL